MSNYHFNNDNPYAALEEDDEFNGPWYRNRTRTMAVLLAAAAVIVLFLMMWHHNYSGKLASAQGSEAATAAAATTPASGDASGNSNANASGDGSKGSTINLNSEGKGSGSGSSASATANGGAAGTNGKDGKDGVDGKTGTTIVYNTIPASPTTVPVTSPKAPVNVDTNGLLNIYADLGNGQPLVNVDAALPPLAKLTANSDLAGVRTQTYDVSGITGHSSTVTLTFLNDLLVGKAKVGF